MNNIKERVIKEANHIINTKETIRQTAQKFKVSKSTVHKDINDRLRKINLELYNELNPILSEHLKTRHIRGGNSTKEKYQGK